jgi:hypothetical protein
MYVAANAADLITSLRDAEIESQTIDISAQCGPTDTIWVEGISAGVRVDLSLLSSPARIKARNYKTMSAEEPVKILKIFKDQFWGMECIKPKDNDAVLLIWETLCAGNSPRCKIRNYSLYDVKTFNKISRPNCDYKCVLVIVDQNLLPKSFLDQLP